MRTLGRAIQADVSAEEYAVVVRLARREGASVATFLRRCVNRYIEAETEDEPLLTERVHGAISRELR